MIKNPAYLKMNRLVIIKDGKRLYNEQFHDGINIIRGEHSVGKSTILDMIFYVLGGELKKDDWKYPADTCTSVNAEITINNRIFTISRPIEPGRVPHIKIYEGQYDDAMKNADEWLDYGPRRNDDKLSFSEMMFELFNWGQFKSDNYQNLTMHQIMRLIYLSQSSDSNRIFRKEQSRADNENTRIAIAEFLLGLDDLETHSYRQALLKHERDFDNSSAELRAYFSLLGEDASLTVDSIQESLTIKHEELTIIDNKKDSLLDSTELLENHHEYELATERNDILVRTQNLTHEINSTNIELHSLKIEIQDCILFGKNLTYRIKALHESKDTYVSLGEVSFAYCPCCLAPIQTSADNETGCALCKSNEKLYSLEEKYIETLNELQYQQRQNDKIIVTLSDNVECLESDLLSKNKILQALNNRLFEISLVSNKRELLITSLIEERTEKLIEINLLKEKIESAKKVDDLKKKREHITKQIEHCRTRIDELEASNITRKQLVYSRLSQLSTKILEGDSGNEDKFKTATQLSSEIDFAKDRWLLNERVNYSDSSNVVKKSALHLALLLFSIHDSSCRYPRFSIMDFECGDINEGRSHNLQKLIISSLAGLSGYQLIMTTSKIDKGLNNKMYGVGRYYGKNDYIIQP